MTPFVIILIVSAVACAGLALFGRAFGWVDRREGMEDRKPLTTPVPLVGGAAVLVGFLLASRSASGFDFGALPWPALLGAFGLGLADDLVRGGLGARSKFAGQCLVGALVALVPGAALADISMVEAFGLGLLTVVSMNAINTYDHADGFAGGVCALGLLPGSAPLAGAVLGYLPFNTLLRQPLAEKPEIGGPPPAHRAPWAMLGDSGSHLLGVVMVTAPGAVWFLLIPLLDLLRVAVGRTRRGQPFWHGDRTHLGHRLAALGFSPTKAALFSALAVAPPLIGLFVTYRQVTFVALLLLSVAIYACLLVATDGALPEAATSSRATESGPGAGGDPSLSGAKHASNGRSGPAEVLRRLPGFRRLGEMAPLDSSEERGRIADEGSPSEGANQPDGPAAGPFAGS